MQKDWPLDRILEIIRNYYSSLEIDLPNKQVLLDIVTEMVLNPNMDLKKAIKKVRKLNGASFYTLSLDEKLPHDNRTLLERISCNDAESIDEESTQTEMPEINIDEYLTQISPERRDFIRGLFERQLSLMEKIANSHSPKDLEDKLEEWERGELKKGAMPRNEFENEFLRFIKDYIIECRMKWLVNRFGEKNAKRIISSIPSTLYPIKTMEKSYPILKELGCLEYIANYPQLLQMEPETIKKRHKKLRSLGLSNKNIATNPRLLGMRLETIEEKHKKLRSKGLSDRSIANKPRLLLMKPETIEERHDGLKSLGLSNKRIANNPQLLETKLETIKKNYGG
jgi:hypothetical protein